MLTAGDFLLPLVAVVLIIGPLWIIAKKGVNQVNAKARILGQIAMFAGVMLVCLIVSVHGLPNINFSIYVINNLINVCHTIGSFLLFLLTR